MERQKFSSNSRWEPIAGYSRAVRVGPFVHIAGTTAFGEDQQIVGVGSSYQQTVQALQNIKKALEAVGANLQNVIRTRIFAIRMEDWEEIARAHGEVFRDIRPVCTLVGVAWLVQSELLVEIEAEAYIS